MGVLLPFVQENGVLFHGQTPTPSSSPQGGGDYTRTPRTVLTQALADAMPFRPRAVRMTYTFGSHPQG